MHCALSSVQCSVVIGSCYQILFRGKKSYKTAVLLVDFSSEQEVATVSRVQSQFCLEGACSRCEV